MTNLTRRRFGRLLLGGPAGMLIPPRVTAKPSGRPPNFIVLLADDLGYGDLGCYGNNAIRTPNLDRMAGEGARLTEFYAAPTCTPARSSLLTGRYALRSGMVRVLLPREKFGLPESEITIAECLRDRGYRTACIGKWHLGAQPRYRPARHGFDYHYGLLYSNDMRMPLVWPKLKLYRNDEVIEKPVRQETLTRRYTDEAVRFIEQNRENPFFLYLPYTMPHVPLSASAEFRGKSRHGLYGDAVEELDWSAGRILAALKQSGLDENTLVLFMSDNGPVLRQKRPCGSAGVLRGGKGSIWEGGVRVPFLARWPGRIPAGVERSGIASTMDLLPTLGHYAGCEAPPDLVIDGTNLAGFLEGWSESPHSEFFYYHGAHLCAVRSRNWKLHLRKPGLYDLDRDPGERRNVAGENPEIAASLSTLAREFQSTMHAGKLPPPRWRSMAL